MGIWQFGLGPCNRGGGGVGVLNWGNAGVKFANLDRGAGTRGKDNLISNRHG